MTQATTIPQTTLDQFFDRIGRVLCRREQRQNFAMYAMGLLSGLERKSVEPIAAAASKGDQSLCAQYHDHLLNFTNSSPWSDAEVRATAAEPTLAKMLESGPLDVLIIDDTGFPKKGTESVAVQRQYSGTLGKVDNCQVAVSLTVATRHCHLPLDFELYLPESWASDAERRKKAKIPDNIRFRTKPEIALDMLAKHLNEGLPPAPLVADSAYGNEASFRGGLTQLGLQYAAGVKKTTLVRQVMTDGSLGPPESVEALAKRLPTGRYRGTTWRQGTNAKLSSHFALLDVEVVNADSAEPRRQRLLIEWPRGNDGPEHYTLCTVSTISPKQLVRITKARWRIEGSYEEMKGELGLDHYEGRSWIGWHHHVSIVLACYPLVILSRLRAFPPSARCAPATCSQRQSSSAPCC